MQIIPFIHKKELTAISKENQHLTILKTGAIIRQVKIIYSMFN